jgi:hypothetical protein
MCSSENSNQFQSDSIYFAHVGVLLVSERGYLSHSRNVWRAGLSPEHVSSAPYSLDESDALGLFGKLKLTICVRPELRAGFFISMVIA